MSSLDPLLLHTKEDHAIRTFARSLLDHLCDPLGPDQLSLPIPLHPDKAISFTPHPSPLNPNPAPRTLHHKTLSGSPFKPDALPIIKAILTAVAHSPDIFRLNGYSLSHIQIHHPTFHPKSKKLLSVQASFPPFPSPKS